MGLEASKTKLLLGNRLLSYLKGEGIDIGCGPDPVLAGVRPFDLEHGDANHISRYVDRKFDFVFSSHCLEHLEQPAAAAKEWLSILKPGGFFVGMVPDEDLYEQGFFPSRFNADHKHTFRLDGNKSWSPVSINLSELLKNLPDTQVITIERQSQGIHPAFLHKFGSTCLLGLRLRMGRIAIKASHRFPALTLPIVTILGYLGAILDQTALPGTRLAQLFFVVQKIR